VLAQRDVRDEAHREEERHERAATVRDERQRHADDGREPQHHRDVDRDVPERHRGDADADHGGGQRTEDGDEASTRFPCNK